MFETTAAYEADVATGDTTINNGTMFFLLSPVGSPVPQSIVSLGLLLSSGWLTKAPPPRGIDCRADNEDDVVIGACSKLDLQPGIITERLFFRRTFPWNLANGQYFCNCGIG